MYILQHIQYIFMVKSVNMLLTDGTPNDNDDCIQQFNAWSMALYKAYAHKLQPDSDDNYNKWEELWDEVSCISDPDCDIDADLDLENEAVNMNISRSNRILLQKHGHKGRTKKTKIKIKKKNTTPANKYRDKKNRDGVPIAGKLSKSELH